MVKDIEHYLEVEILNTTSCKASPLQLSTKASWIQVWVCFVVKLNSQDKVFCLFFYEECFGISFCHILLQRIHYSQGCANR